MRQPTKKQGLNVRSQSIQPFLIVILCALIGCNTHPIPLPRTALAARPIWLTPSMVDSVRSAMERGEKAGEVPVGACISIGTDTGRVIVTGYNTTQSKGDAAGHAEINALTKAIAALGGVSRFSAIHRDSIFLVTSFEPCPMCAGAMAMWKITPSHTAVFLPKLPEWKMPELEAVQQLRDGWILTGDDTLQLEFFCHRVGFREAFPQKCR